MGFSRAGAFRKISNSIVAKLLALMSSITVAKNLDILKLSRRSPIRSAGLRDGEVRQNERIDRGVEWPSGASAPELIGSLRSIECTHINHSGVARHSAELCYWSRLLSILALPSAASYHGSRSSRNWEQSWACCIWNMSCQRVPPVTLLDDYRKYVNAVRKNVNLFTCLTTIWRT